MDGKELGPRKRREVDVLSGRNPDELLGPIASVQALLEELDVHVADVALATHRKGAISIVRAGLMPVVLVNTNHTKSRRAVTRRMLLAHEIAHVLLDGGEQEMGGAPIERLRDLEIRANNFAPNFLAPPEDVRSATARVTDPTTIVNTLAELFGFSFEAAAWHAANCAVIDRALVRDLIAESQERSHGRRSAEARWESSEHAARTRETSSDITPHPLVQGLLSDLVLEATRRGVVSEGRCREILEVT
jgi:Zn-dependent peptidase ImmA (M78 family)